jgi:hypothetical protein
VELLAKPMIMGLQIDILLFVVTSTIKISVTIRVTRRLEKMPNFSKSNLKSLQVQKGQNINNKAQFESPKDLHQTTFETLIYPQQTMF